MPSPTESVRDAIVAVSPYGADGASTRVRLNGWFEYTGVPVESYNYLNTSNNQVRTVARRLPQALAAEVGLRRLAGRLAERTLILSREATPFSSGGIEASLLRNAARAVYDFDDALYADSSATLSKVWSKRRTWMRSVQAADVVIAGSEILADAASEIASDVRLVPSCIDPGEYTIKSEYRLGSSPRAIWIGSPATESFLTGIADPLLELHSRYGLRLTVISAGHAELGPISALVDRVEWNRHTFGAELVRADFGLMPLPDTPYTRGKCSYKLLQYAAAGIPVIGSPVGANDAALRTLGGLPATTGEDWVAAVSSIIELGDAERAQLGAATRSGVVAEYSYARWAPTWLDALGVATEV